MRKRHDSGPVCDGQPEQHRTGWRVPSEKALRASDSRALKRLGDVDSVAGFSGLDTDPSE